MADPIPLKKALEMAKKCPSKKPLHFAFVGQGVDGELIIGRNKVPKAHTDDAKESTGSNKVMYGKCYSNGSNSVVFLLKKDPPGAMTTWLKTITRDAGTPIIPEFLTNDNAEEEDKEDTEDGKPQKEVAGAGAGAPAAGAGAPAAAGAAPAAKGGAAPAGDVAAGQGAPPAASDAKAVPKAPPAPNLSQWKTARQNAIAGLKDLATKVAKTKHGSASGVVLEINEIIKKLPEAPAPNKIGELEKFIRDDDALKAAEESPKHFHDLNLRAPLLEALATLRA